MDLSLHVDRGRLLVGGAGVLAALTLSSDGPLGIARIFNRRIHVIVAMVFGGILVLAPAIPALRPDVAGIIIVEFGGIGLVRLSMLTRTDIPAPKPGRAFGPLARRSLVNRPGPGQLSGPGAVASADSGSDSGSGPGAARGTGPGLFPEAQVDRLARRVGRAARSAADFASESATVHGPAAKRGARRTLRAAGRTAGRLRRSL